MRYILFLFVIISCLVYKIIRYVYKFRIDYFNISLIKPYKFCIWNIYHILFNFSLLYTLNAKTYNIYYLVVILINVIWYNIEESLFKKMYGKHAISSFAKKGDCYNNIFVPDLKQDLIFNSIGFLLYYIYSNYQNVFSLFSLS